MTGEHTDEYLEKAVESEYDYCVSKHGNFKNHHEAYGVMKEEMEEVQDAAEMFNETAFKYLNALWLLVKNDDMNEEGAGNYIKVINDVAEELEKECVQVQAMCRKWNDLLAKENEPEQKKMSEQYRDYLVEKHMKELKGE